MPAEASLFANHTAEFTGTVVHDAQARLKQIDTEGHMVPVIVFDKQAPHGAAAGSSYPGSPAAR